MLIASYHVSLKVVCHLYWNWCVVFSASHWPRKLRRWKPGSNIATWYNKTSARHRRSEW